MKNIQAYEFEDLPQDIQDKIREREINSRVEFEIEMLGNELDGKKITEDEYYDALGCTKSYAESTAWFVPSCYYDKHKKDVEGTVTEDIADMLFTENGEFIQNK